MDKTSAFDWNDDRAVGYVKKSLPHFNNARAATDAYAACDALAKGLDQVKDGLRPRGDGGAISAFNRLLQDGLPSDGRRWLVAQRSLSELAHFEPLIQNEETLKQSLDYQPGAPVPDPLRGKAEREHRQFRNAYGRWQTDPTNDHQAAVLKKLGVLLYEVRSNIMHGGKLRSTRDREVAEVVRPVLCELADAILAFPSRRLAVYGTLRPGREDHHVLSAIQGIWNRAWIEGHLFEARGLPAFRPDSRDSEPATRHGIDLLESPTLVDKWPQLDEFEGSGYRRSLVVVYREDDSATVANVYEYVGDRDR